MQFWLNFFSAVVLLGAVSQWIAWRLKIPSILPLLVIGFGAGQFFADSIVLNESVLFAIVSLSVAVIMLEGGLTLRFEELKESGKPLVRLFTIGVLITWGLAAAAFYYIGKFDFKVALLVGAILTVTGPTVIGPLLRNVKPNKNINSILKWEGIVIDPIGAVLAVLVFVGLFGSAHGEHHEPAGWIEVARQLGLTLLVGFGLGYVVGKLLLMVLRKHWIPDYLQSVIVLALALALFSLSNLIQKESGLLTVTVLGVVLINQASTQVRHIIEFKENLRVLLISCLFIVLGGRIGWQDLVTVWKEALLISIFLIVVVRPLSVFLSSIGTELTWQERTFLALLAPRGIVAAAVSAIFAIEISHLGGEWVAQAEKIPPIIFCIVFCTVTFYGLSAGPIAKKLGIATPNPQGVLIAGATPWGIELANAIKDAGFRVVMIDANHRAASEARMRGIQSHTANILSDYATEEIDLSGIGRYMAMTENDEVNALSCINFGHHLGRSNVFQISPLAAQANHRTASSKELAGRTLFDESVTSQSLRHKYMNRELKVKSTLITEEFTYDKYLAENGEDITPMLILRAGGSLSIVTDESATPADGDTILAISV